MSCGRESVGAYSSAGLRAPPPDPEFNPDAALFKVLYPLADLSIAHELPPFTFGFTTNKTIAITCRNTFAWQVCHYDQVWIEKDTGLSGQDAITKFKKRVIATSIMPPQCEWLDYWAVVTSTTNSETPGTLDKTGDNPRSDIQLGLYSKWLKYSTKSVKFAQDSVRRMTKQEASDNLKNLKETLEQKYNVPWSEVELLFVGEQFEAAIGTAPTEPAVDVSPRGGPGNGRDGNLSGGNDQGGQRGRGRGRGTG